MKPMDACAGPAPARSCPLKRQPSTDALANGKATGAGGVYEWKLGFDAVLGIEQFDVQYDRRHAGVGAQEPAGDPQDAG